MTAVLHNEGMMTNNILSFFRKTSSTEVEPSMVLHGEEISLVASLMAHISEILHKDTDGGNTVMTISGGI